MRRYEPSITDCAMPTRYARDEARFRGGRDAHKEQEDRP